MRKRWTTIDNLNYYDHVFLKGFLITIIPEREKNADDSVQNWDQGQNLLGLPENAVDSPIISKSPKKVGPEISHLENAEKKANSAPNLRALTKAFCNPPILLIFLAAAVRQTGNNWPRRRFFF